MVNLYCDSSALVKVFLTENDTSAMQSHYAKAEQVWVSQLTWVELQSAFARRLRGHESSETDIQKAMQEIESEWRSFKVLMPLPMVTEYAGRLCHSLQLRAYDAVQLATARIAEQQSGLKMTFACFDQKLNQAAKTLGLDTL